LLKRTHIRALAAILLIMIAALIGACTGSPVSPTVASASTNSLPTTPPTSSGVTPSIVNLPGSTTTVPADERPTNSGPSHDFFWGLMGDGYKPSIFESNGQTDPATISVEVLVDPARGSELYQTVYDHALRLGEDYATSVGKGLRLKVVLVADASGHELLDSRDFSIGLDDETEPSVVILAGPGFTAPQGFAHANWGSGDGEVSFHREATGKAGPRTGPDLMAVSPDGGTVAVYDRYASPPRVNFYTRPAFAGSVPLEQRPLSMLVDDDRGLYLLYAENSDRSVMLLDAAGRTLATVTPPGQQTAEELLWAGDDMYVRFSGGSEPNYLLVMRGGNPVTYPSSDNRWGVSNYFPLASGGLLVTRRDVSAWSLAVALETGGTLETTVRLPDSAADLALTPCGSAFAGTWPVLVLRTEKSGMPVGYYVAVDMTSGRTKTATVRLDFTENGLSEVGGGMATVGPDAVYVMRHYNDGMQLTRAPFE
jgi:hypothetical protein